MHVPFTARIVCTLLVIGAATCGSAPRFEPSITSPPAASTTTGVASWYGPGFDGKKTASGERFNSNHLTAAHRTLPFGSIVRVTNLQNGRTVDVRINDRGPFTKGRIIDLSKAAAREIGLIERGIGTVELRVLSLASN
jgi:rare lipoprotein A